MFTDILDDEEDGLYINSVDYTDIYNSCYKANIGDALAYNRLTNHLYVGAFYEENIGEVDPIGIIIKEHTSISTYDIVLRSYLTSSGIVVPYQYHDKEKYIPTYLMDLFKRYLSRYIREMSFDMTNAQFFVPDIAILDYIEFNIYDFKSAYKRMWGEERTESFFERMYTNGIFSIYKNKYYQWLPVEGKKRVINNLTYGQRYEFLPVFRITLETINEMESQLKNE